MTGETQPDPRARGPQGTTPTLPRSTGASKPRRRRWALRLSLTLAAAVLGSSVVPELRMLALDRAIRHLKEYRQTNCRFPLSALELSTALRGRTGVFDSILRTGIEVGGYTWDDMGVHYATDSTGSGFTIQFNHDWFVYDTGRYYYDTASDSWGHHFD